MAMSQKDKKPKDKKDMGSKKKDDQGAFTKKPWAESSGKEKAFGVAATAAAAGALYAVLKS